MLRTNAKPHELIKRAKFSYSIVSLVFHKCSYRAYQNGLNRVPKAEVLRVSLKVQTLLVRIPVRTCILIYYCTGCSTSKIYLS